MYFHFDAHRHVFLRLSTSAIFAYRDLFAFIRLVPLHFNDKACYWNQILLEKTITTKTTRIYSRLSIFLNINQESCRCRWSSFCLHNGITSHKMVHMLFNKWHKLSLYPRMFVVFEYFFLDFRSFFRLRVRLCNMFFHYSWDLIPEFKILILNTRLRLFFILLLQKY